MGSAWTKSGRLHLTGLGPSLPISSKLPRRTVTCKQYSNSMRGAHGCYPSINTTRASRRTHPHAPALAHQHRHLLSSTCKSVFWRGRRAGEAERTAKRKTAACHFPHPGQERYERSYVLDPPPHSRPLFVNCGYALFRIQQNLSSPAAAGLCLSSEPRPEILRNSLHHPHLIVSLFRQAM